MKIITLILAAAALMAGSQQANAQLLKNLLGTAASTVAESTGNSAVSALVNAVSNAAGITATVSLPGTWIYAGTAVALEGENTLTNLAGTALSSEIEGKLNGYLAKIGITAGKMSYTFTNEGSFTCTVSGIPLEGTYTVQNEGKTVRLQYGKTMKYLSMTGTLTGSGKTCKIVFPADKFLTFVKKAISLAGSKAGETGSMLSSVTNSYKGMKVGFTLNKQ